MVRVGCCGRNFGWGDMVYSDGTTGMGSASKSGAYKCVCKLCGKRWVMNYDRNDGPITFEPDKVFLLPKLKLEELSCIN